MSAPVVSVVVSAYNRPALLREALRSVLDQTYRNLQIVVQDDSTEDSCQAAVAEFDDSRITYTRNRPALGTIHNLLAGYRKATGTYLCTLNDDDLYTSGYIQAMVEALEDHPECCLAFCDHSIVDDTGTIDQHESDVNSRRFGRDHLPAGVVANTLDTALVTKSVPGMFALYRRELMDFSDFPAEVSSGYDFWLTYLSVRSGQPIYYVPQRLTSYRVHAASQTSSFGDPQQRLRSLAYDLYTQTRFASDPRLGSIHPAVDRQIAQIQTSIGATRLRLGQRGAALQAFWSSFRRRPAPQAVVGLALTVLPLSLATRVFDMKKTSAEDRR